MDSSFRKILNAMQHLLIHHSGHIDTSDNYSYTTQVLELEIENAQRAPTILIAQGIRSFLKSETSNLSHLRTQKTFNH